MLAISTRKHKGNFKKNEALPFSSNIFVIMQAIVFHHVKGIDFAYLDTKYKEYILSDKGTIPEKVSKLSGV